MVLLKARTRFGGEHDDWIQRVATQQLLQMHYDSLFGSNEISIIPRVFHGTSRQRYQRFATTGRVAPRYARASQQQITEQCIRKSG